MSIKKIEAHEAATLNRERPDERGAALVLVIIILLLLGAISVSVLAVVTHETKIAGSDLRRTESYFAAASGIEKMTNDFSNLFQRTSNPTAAQLQQIASNPPQELTSQCFTFNQSLVSDDLTLATMRATQGITNSRYPSVVIDHGPLVGLTASVAPYIVTSTATRCDGTQVKLQRNINNYLIPLFQFGTFSDGDLEFWPQPPMTFNGRVHANGNIYFGGDITFTSKVTTANEAVRTLLRNKATLTTGYSAGNPRFIINGVTVAMNQGSVVGGPSMTQPRTDKRGDFPGSPTGTDNTVWKTKSVTAVQSGVADQFGGQLLTKSTGALPLLLPMQLDGNKPREIIKRPMPDDTSALTTGRFSSKAEIRILIDDENVNGGPSNVAGIPANKGVYLSQFDPDMLDGGNALRPVTDTGSYGSTADWLQGNPALNKKAMTVRGVKSYTITSASTPSTITGGKNLTSVELTNSLISGNVNYSIPKTPNGAMIPPGAGVKGHILIEARRPDGTFIDVTRAILSMGMTVGEPNGIVYLQRPEWAAYMQGGRDRKGDSAHHNFLNYFLDTTVTDRRALADGELPKAPAFAPAGYLNSTDSSFDDDPHSGSTPFLPTTATMARDDQFSTASGSLNRIVPITMYNVREGRIDEALSEFLVYGRGITTVVDINMRNLARWLDGVYDNNLLRGTSAIGSSIDGSEGYVVYVSDRRGDRVKTERNASGAIINTTNGLVDNEDVYGYNQTNGSVPDPGEDVIDAGFDPATNKNKKDSLQVDVNELPGPSAIPTPANMTPPTGVDATDYTRAVTVTEWNPSPPATPTATSPNYFFRRAVRLLNGEDMVMTGATGKLCATKGITVATENMVYIWGNYNTTGITGQPSNGSTPNDPTQSYYYTGDQIPASIASDAFFPLSKTWYDALPAIYPEGGLNRIADAGAASDATAIPVGQETSVRAGIISGTTLSAMVANTAPTYFLKWLNGGVHNFPRFLETWGVGGTWEKRWNYTGSFILLYNSTQAVSPYSVLNSVVYYPPQRNWGFDITFMEPAKLPPGTPQFQFISPTAFKQIF
ncbi:MAG TPA: hypothetical protein VGC89_00065 [Pyrinomonadaceae bacterium]